ncbi:poly [ADP-ribose] polymerase-like isoform X2 [Haematobia irritans]|uniref:poly [ADP-ribose] polymerase-like isoform X2 n=1 Tax=Haematobia irritans TaxID=7368 RepID=UPI003F50548D
MEDIELPYKVEYARSGRSSCKGCKNNIGQGSLRIAAMVQSAFHDSKQPNWFHESCFFKKQRPLSVGDIQNLENIRYDDQERIQKKVEECISVVEAAGSSKTSKKRSKAEISALSDFSIEYAKSGRAGCRGCDLKILKDQIRVRKTVYDTEIGMKYGGQALWHHVECFAQLRTELGWLDTGNNLPGFKTLKECDMELVANLLPAIKAENAPVAKKTKLEKLDFEEAVMEKELLKTVKEQMKKFHNFRDLVKGEMSKKDMLELLIDNNLEPVTGDSEKLLDQLADLLTFGAIIPCEVCNGHQILFQKSAYVCNGDLTEWTKCAKTVREPKRNPCKISPALKSQYKFLKHVSRTPEIRAIRYIPPSTSTISKSVSVKTGDEIDGIRISFSED